MLLAPLAAALALSGGGPADTPSFPHTVLATQHRGVARIAGMRVSLRHGVPHWRKVRHALGRPAALDRDPGACTARYRPGLELLFVTFGGGRESCGHLPLQTATITGRGWRVRILGDRTYRIGQRGSVIPGDAKRIRGWGGGGYELASMPFAGNDDATTVLAHVNRRNRIDRFYLWIGGAGD
jgi:hypothetical protein